MCPDEDYPFEEEYDFDAEYSNERFWPVAQCKRCGSTAVRWRQQGGKWVLFSEVAGVLHTCPRPAIVTDFD
jgi:hypothetical protein